MEAVECGAAALGSVLAYHGRVEPLAVLRRECDVSRDGSNAANILKAARRYGMVAKGFKKSLESVQEMKFPVIVFWNFNHFVVLEGFARGRAYINDPEDGRRSVPLSEFDESFTGVVLAIEPGPEFVPGGEKRSVVRALLSALRGNWGAVAYCFLAGLLLVAPRLALPVLTQLFVDEVLIGGRLQWIHALVLAMVAAIALQGALMYLRLTHLRLLRVKLSVGLSTRFLWHVLRLPVTFFAQRYSGEISSRLGLNDRVAHVLSGQLAAVAIDSVMLGFYAALMLFYDPLLTLVGAALALVNVVGLNLLSRYRQTANRRLLQEEGKLAGVGIAGLQSIETLKASAQEGSFFVRWAGHHAQTMNVRQSMALMDQGLVTLPTLLAVLTNALVLVVGGFRVIDGGLTIGMLIAFVSLMHGFQAPVRSLLDMGSTLQELAGDFDRLRDVLDNPTDPMVAASRPDQADEAPLQGFVELRDITFGYARVAAPLIEEFSLSLRPGERVALVGGSGSGKSTLAKLVAGLYQPWSGAIELDGRPLFEQSRATMATSVAMVDQELFFFEGTVRDNLTLWNPHLRHEDVERACRDAEIHDKVMSLPGAYDAQLSEGASNLSGGERQRLEIARALVQNPALLILDEATSALDAETEHRIDMNLRRRGMSCIVVAHRLSTIRDCDEIIVLSGGKVVQRGPYDALRGQGGAFASLLQHGGEGSLVPAGGAHG
jgi:ATP-binding cassette subfamily C protein